MLKEYLTVPELLRPVTFLCHRIAWIAVLNCELISPCALISNGIPTGSSLKARLLLATRCTFVSPHTHRYLYIVYPTNVGFSSVNTLQPHELQHARLPCPSPVPGVYPNPCPLSHDAIQTSHPLLPLLLLLQYKFTITTHLQQLYS